MTVAIEDTLARYQRSIGKNVKWIPGFDHAGIATQTVVEKDLWMRMGLKRQDMSTADFVKHCTNWKDERSKDIKRQLNRIGASLHWDRFYYTMDENFSAATVEAFCRLHDEGLIERKESLVNWCPFLQSTISDQEVDYISFEKGPSQIPLPDLSTDAEKSFLHGYLYRIYYKLADSADIRLSVETTRPETVLADVALAVNPNDVRYANYIGKSVFNPLTNRVMPIIADEAVLIDKGSGILKVTPAHDFVDFEIAKRHQLSLKVHCLDNNGNITGDYEEFSGLSRFLARDKVIEKLKNLDLYEGKRTNSDGTVPVCSRTGDILEPMLKEQWFLNCDEMIDEAERAVQSGKIRFKPDFMEKTWHEWCRNRRPWCLSRQLLWGHPVPAYRFEGVWKTARSEQEAYKLFDILPNVDRIERDPDVLDTWFSSALIPLVVNGWPFEENLLEVDEAGQLNQSPLNLLETGHDILQFWVVRMVMLCRKLDGILPFRYVLLHGLIRDDQGRKMSKSLGNAVDIIEIMDGQSMEATLADGENIASNRAYGSDGLRFALLSHDTTSLDIHLDVHRWAEKGGKFCNKIWNLVAFAERVWQSLYGQRDNDTYGDFHDISARYEDLVDLATKERNETVMDRWLLSRLSDTTDLVRKNLERYELHAAFIRVQNFIHKELCDVYLETCKRDVWSQNLVRMRDISVVLKIALDESLRCLSLFMPYISACLYERIFAKNVFEQPFPENVHLNEPILDAKVTLALDAVASVRSFKNHYGFPSAFGKTLFTGVIHCDFDGIEQTFDTIDTLCGLRLTEKVHMKRDTLYGHVPILLDGHKQAKLSVKAEGVQKASIIEQLIKKREKLIRDGDKNLAEIKSYELRLNTDNHDFDKNDKKKSQREKLLKRIELLKATVESRQTSMRTLDDLIKAFDENS